MPDLSENECSLRPSSKYDLLAAGKDSFNSLPDETKPLYLDSVTRLESDFNRTFESLAAEKQALVPFNGFHDLFRPFEQGLVIVGKPAGADTELDDEFKDSAVKALTKKVHFLDGQ